MKVLVGCEYSGRVRDAFIAQGHDAMSCDLLPTDAPGPHYQGDIFDIINDGWDLMIAHPPCTYMANSGVQHLYIDGKPNVERWQNMYEAADFFKRLLHAPIKRKALENPIMHKYAKRIIGHNYSQVVHPSWFGHLEQKQTCLWLVNLPHLIPSNDVTEEMKQLPANQRQRLHYLPPSPDRWKVRSTTYQGIADAMATQWGSNLRTYQPRLFQEALI